VYGPTFYQVSVYSRRGARVGFLSKIFASSEDRAGSNEFRFKAEEIIQTDENEINEEYGQRVSSIFHDADFIVNLDLREPSIDAQVIRFSELLFSSNNISPSKIEFGMFAAKASALRTLDLSRQVGAAIFSDAGDILCLGCNEVPKAGGGAYWSDEVYDDRDYVRGYDSNDRRKEEILRELLTLAGHEFDVNELVGDPHIRDSQMMDAIEYGRAVHAEMSALSDAARRGISIRDAVLYCTTFPCHLCAKHLIASGLKEVVFLEPYPKSLAADLHSDALEIEHADRGIYSSYPAVVFEHFYGITPRRYRELFERTRRKNKRGSFVPYATISGSPAPYLNIQAPFYTQLEEVIIRRLGQTFLDNVEEVSPVAAGG
jgi:deoxycytidylate deaminase